MSIKEAISWLEGLTWHEGEDVPIYDTDVEAINMAIKALEQESILDKIRAEVIELRSKQNVGVLECLDIIEKYKAESEEGEDKE